MHRFSSLGVRQFAGTVAVVLGCACPLQGLALQNSPQKSSGGATAAPVLSAQLPPLPGSGSAAPVQPKAMRMYRRAADELLHQRPKDAEKDAMHAVHLDPGFADADALVATAALAQRQFSRAKALARKAVQLDARNEKAWVALATADNHLAQYADAAEALRHVPNPETADWQVDYQWARAEAGLGNAREMLLCANRAALAAPQDFAPLHLLRASALLAAGQSAASADELGIYLHLVGQATPDRAALVDELHRLRAMPAVETSTPASRDAASEPNALAN